MREDDEKGQEQEGAEAGGKRPGKAAAQKGADGRLDHAGKKEREENGRGPGKQPAKDGIQEKKSQ